MRYLYHGGYYSRTLPDDGIPAAALMSRRGQAAAGLLLFRKRHAAAGAIFGLAIMWGVQFKRGQAAAGRLLSRKRHAAAGAIVQILRENLTKIREKILEILKKNLGNFKKKSLKF